MKIEFYFKENGLVIVEENARDMLFVMNDIVYSDNLKTYESQSALIGFEDCISEAPHIGWRPVPD